MQSTVLDAFDRDYRVIVVRDAVADREPHVHEFLLDHIFPKRGTVISAEQAHALLH